MMHLIVTSVFILTIVIWQCLWVSYCDQQSFWNWGHSG